MMAVSMVIELMTVVLLIGGTASYDGCHIHHYLCGDVCIDKWAQCYCGDEVIINSGSNGVPSWCCTNSTCFEGGGGEGVCEQGTVLPLTEKCHGSCNSFPDDPARGRRSFASCSNATNSIGSDQCISETKLGDGTTDCVSGSDLDPFAPSTPLDLSKLVQCYTEYQGGLSPALTCSGSNYKTNDVGCLPMYKWCSPKQAFICDELGGRWSNDADLCSNYTFWEDRPCGLYFGRTMIRCTGSWPGQCVKELLWGTGDRYSCQDYSDSYTAIEGSQAPVTMGLPCTTRGGHKGLTCLGAQDGCLVLDSWCNSLGQGVWQCEEGGRGHSLDLAICSNSTLWKGVPCPSGRRCHGTLMGECSWKELWHDGQVDCIDGSDEGLYNPPEFRNTNNNLAPLGDLTFSEISQNSRAGKQKLSMSVEECSATEGVVCERRETKGNVCMDKKLICDSFPNCLGGEDEEDCKDKYKERKFFPPGATFKCQLPYRVIIKNGSAYNFSTHRAVFYDGKVECWGGEDETPPYLPHSLPYIVFSIPALLVALHLLLTLSPALWKRKSNQNIAGKNFSDNVQAIVSQNQAEIRKIILKENANVRVAITSLQSIDISIKERRSANKIVMRSLIEIKGSLAEAILWMKDIMTIHPEVCQSVLDDYIHSGTLIQKLIDKKDVFLKKFSLVSLLKRTFVAQALNVDLGRDVILLVAMASAGHQTEFFTFSTAVTFLMATSIIAPLLASGLNTAIKHPFIIFGFDIWAANRETKNGLRLWIIRSATVLMSFTVPSLLVASREDARQRKKELEEEIEGSVFDKSEEEESNFKLKEIKEYIDIVKKGLLIFKRLELGIEVFLQISITITMLLLAPSYSSSPTTSGLQGLFNTKKDGKEDSGFLSFIGLHIANTTLLILSVIWSLKTMVMTYINIKKEGKGGVLRLTAKLALLLYGLLGYSLRITCTIAWFAPFLGLGSILAHWTAEQIPLKFDVFQKYNNTNNPVAFHTLHRSNYMDTAHPTPPPYTLYTTITLQEAAFVFLILTLLYGVLIVQIKRELSPAFMLAKWTSQLSHVIECFSLSDCYQDWDRGGGGPADYRRRWAAVWRETMATICLQCLSNLVLLVPLVTTALNVHERHVLVEKFLRAPLNQEKVAFERITLLAWLLPLMVLLTSMTNLLMVFVYQVWFHPWKIIQQQDILLNKDQPSPACQPVFDESLSQEDTPVATVEL